MEDLNLSDTEITDKVVDSIAKMKNLKAVCLGNVNVHPEAIEKLKEHNRARKGSDRLRFGYTQRMTGNDFAKIIMSKVNSETWLG